jgi:hypothetical protein
MRFGAIAVCALALAVGREFYVHSIAPFSQRETEALREAGDLGERVDGAQKTMADIQAQEKDADRVRSELERLRDELPADAAVAVPALVKEHFARHGIVVPLVRLNTMQEEPELPGCEHGYWSVALPIDDAGRNITAMLLAVADFDQQNPFVRVLDFSIRPDPENPGGRVGSLNLAALVRK